MSHDVCSYSSKEEFHNQHSPITDSFFFVYFTFYKLKIFNFIFQIKIFTLKLIIQYELHTKRVTHVLVIILFVIAKCASGISPSL